MSLGEAEKVSDGVSSQYIAALEAGEVKFPAPHILHALAGAYVVSYVKLMELAGHVRPRPITGEIGANLTRNEHAASLTHP